MRVLFAGRDSSVGQGSSLADSSDFITAVREGCSELVILTAPHDEYSHFQRMKDWVEKLAGAPLVEAGVYPHMFPEPVPVYASPQETIQKLKDLLERQSESVRRLHFLDASLFPSVRWLREFAPLYVQNVGLPFTCQIPLDLVTEESAALLAGTGCEVVCFRLDPRAGDPDDEGLVGGAEVEDIRRSFAILRRHGVARWSHNLIGMPGESREQILRTIRMNAEIDPEGARAFLIPGALDSHPGQARADEWLFLQCYFWCLIRLYRWGRNLDQDGRRRWARVLDSSLSSNWLPRKALVRARQALGESCHE